MFIHAVGEYSEVDTPIRQICREFKPLVKGFIRQLCQKAGAKDSARLAEELALLFEGAIVTAQVSQNPKAAQIAKRACKTLVIKLFLQRGKNVSGAGCFRGNLILFLVKTFTRTEHVCMKSRNWHYHLYFFIGRGMPDLYSPHV